jgi:glutamyl endopeptidase
VATAVTTPGVPSAAEADNPVANAPTEAVVTQTLSQDPSPGEGAEAAAPANATEAVEDHKKTEAALAELWRPPESDQLLDIAIASFGEPPPALETVHGPDDRVQITNTSVYPWRAHASLLITANDNSTWIGTGWFIGPHTLATAGHVVFIKNSGVPNRDGWVKSIDVMPGRNGATLPYGSVKSTNFRSVSGWTGSGDQNYDYGAIIIPTELGATTGWFGFGVYADDDLTATTGNISGYPGDKPVGTQWYDFQKIASVSSHKLYYDIDTMGGQSGSAVYRITPNGRYGIGVHAYGGASTNSATRIRTPVFNNLLAWKA